MHSKELWLVQENHATVKLESKITSYGLKTHSKSRIELCNQQTFKKCWKVKSVFVIRAALWAKKLGCCQNIAGVENICSEKLQLQSTLEAIQFKFWMKRALVRVKICVLCGWWFSNQFDIVSETPYSCDTVGCELYIASCTLLAIVPWNRVENSCRKARLYVCFTWF